MHSGLGFHKSAESKSPGEIQKRKNWVAAERHPLRAWIRKNFASFVSCIPQRMQGHTTSHLKDKKKRPFSRDQLVGRQRPAHSRRTSEVYSKYTLKLQITLQPAAEVLTFLEASATESVSVGIFLPQLALLEPSFLHHY